MNQLHLHRQELQKTAVQHAQFRVNRKDKFRDNKIENKVLENNKDSIP